MSIIKTLVIKVRLKLRDMDAAKYSAYEVMDAINETISELRQVVKLYYKQMTFPIPDAVKLKESDETGWPDDFDSLIIDHSLILLSAGDYATKEEAKSYWKSKVISLAGTFKKEKIMQADCWNLRYNDEIEDDEEVGESG
ncbi:hypothetical protein EV210_101153 [Anaerospora hongkongensis]|uniref:Uncharacterized protein n=1 Tax=Anaerospora hongkongensis TaxID=244830 RepID=A0A4R1QAK3_9FIRM|nr:hypothetical protein [Anaerospora hongkongensis]TCL39955.1 hypothetical protein EV210_101153 [Anaerospora hongkongensis]